MMSSLKLTEALKALLTKVLSGHLLRLENGAIALPSKTKKKQLARKSNCFN